MHILVKKLCVGLILYLLSPVLVFPQPVKIDREYRIISPDQMAAKNFYFVSLIDQISGLRQFISSDPRLNELSVRRYTNLTRARDTESMIKAFRLSDEYVKVIGDVLAELYSENNVLGNVVRNHLYPSGCYYLFSELSPREFLRKVWEQDASGINRIIDIYGAGKKPRYPLIDSISFNTKNRGYQELIRHCKDYISEECNNQQAFHDIALKAANILLDINERSEAVDFEPLAETVNRESYNYIHEIDWKKYPYSLILVLGAGPDSYNVPLSAGGKLRLRLAAGKYSAGLAPLIVVSGGRVHPYKTKYSEAYEMKKYLVEKCNVPEKAIIMEPHARHTTTNVRNCVRIMFRAGIPVDKCALISSFSGHISNVESNAFAERCMREIGVKPYTLGKRLSDHLIEFYPVIDALHINPSDPLDP